MHNLCTLEEAGASVACVPPAQHTTCMATAMLGMWFCPGLVGRAVASRPLEQNCAGHMVTAERRKALTDTWELANELTTELDAPNTPGCSFSP